MKPYNERLPLIDAAIDYFITRHGGYPSQCQYMVEFNPETHAWCAEGYSEKYLFTRDEFNQRAKELGYVNGYKYGVEYETNGEKPDLLDDVEVEFIRDYMDSFRKTKVEQICWEGIGRVFPVKKFRIVDERYKTKEQDMSNDWYENGELPPFGEVVIFTRKDGFGKGLVTKEWDDGAEVEVISHKIVCGTALPVCWNPQEENASTVLQECLRPFRTETGKLLEEIERNIKNSGEDIFYQLNTKHIKKLAKYLHEQGYRKIKPMSKEEFVDQFDVNGKFCEELYDAGCRFLDLGEHE